MQNYLSSVPACAFLTPCGIECFCCGFGCVSGDCFLDALTFGDYVLHFVLHFDLVDSLILIKIRHRGDIPEVRNLGLVKCTLLVRKE